MKKQKAEEIQIVPNFTAQKLQYAINSLYEKVANHTGKSIYEIKQATIIINKGEISIT